MKNRRVWLFVFLTMLVLAACSKEKTAKIETASGLKDKVIGTVTPPVTTKQVEQSIANQIGGKPKEVRYFNRYSDCIMAVKSGKIDAALSPKFCADYFVKRNTDLKMVANEPVKVNVVMAVRSEDAQLKNELDKAITTLQENGSLKRLEDQWVTNLPVNNELSNGELPEIAGARTVNVGVCGDYIPLDYIAANGRPAGYNVALLTEMGKLLKINFKFVSVETQARFTALSSKKIDLIFCNLDANTPGLQALKNKSWVATKPYFSSQVGCFLVKN